MLDIRYIRDNPDEVQRAVDAKKYRVSIADLIVTDDKRRDALAVVEDLRTRRNEIAARMSGGRPDDATIAEGKAVKNDLADKESDLRDLDQQVAVMMQNVPNIMASDVPIGDEEDSVEVERWGEQTSGASDHIDFASAKGWIDFERGAKVAGNKFYYLRGDLARLENALTQYALDFVTTRGFELLSVPHLANQRTMTGTGFAPRTSDQSDEYAIDGEDLSLIATAEIPLTGFHADEIIDEADLPLRYTALTPCYRREAGTYGKHTRGLFRVHQFNKLEMYAFTTPEQSADMHEEILQLEKELWQSLEIPYQIINIASGDMGAPAYKKYDLQYWSPVDGSYRELTSCSNCTDYQTRNLGIRIRRSDGSLVMAHSLNGTATALARSLVAIIETYQQPDGSLRVPQVLRPYMGNRESL